jgi:tetratricopeptide (TPR) repeat protein
MDFTKQYQKAEDAYKKRNYDYAIEIYLSILKMDPDQTKARGTLRALVIRKKEEGLFKGAGRLAKVSFAAKVKTLQLKKAHDEIITESDRFLTQDPENTTALKALGHSLLAGEQLDGAKQVFEHLRHLTPKDADVYRCLGQVHVAQNRLEDAKKLWEVALQLNPHDAEAHRQVRDLTAKITSQVWEGKGDYREVLRDQQIADLLERQTHLIRTDEDIDKNLVDLDRFIEDEREDHNLAKLWRKKGELLERRRRYDEAMAAYRKQKEFNPEAYDVEERIGDCRLKSLEEKVRALKEDPSRADEYRQVQEQYTRANIEELQRRIREHPTDMKHRFDLGRVAMRVKNWDLAIESLQSAVNDAKYQFNSYLLLAQCFGNKEMWDFAHGQCDRAMAGTGGRKNEEWKAAMYVKADLNERAGNSSAALEHFEQIYSIDISYRDVKKRYEELRAQLKEG